MNESLRASLQALLFFSAIGCLTWLDTLSQRAALYSFRIGCSVVAILCSALLLWAHRRKDKVPDFLARVTSRYFERDGFCFAVLPQVNTGDLRMHIYFQNRYEHACKARIMIAGPPGLFKADSEETTFTLEVACGPAEFGRSSIPIAIPRELQGATTPLEVYAKPIYQNGRGSLLRYREGLRVGAPDMDGWREGLQIAGALAGMAVLCSPARIQLTLPLSGSEAQKVASIADTRTIWRLGDPLPNSNDLIGI